MLANDSPSPGRALVALEHVERNPRRYGVENRPAAFLAHLIAAARQMPQTRERRRAEPAEAIAAYRSALSRLRTR